MRTQRFGQAMRTAFSSPNQNTGAYHSNSARWLEFDVHESFGSMALTRGSLS